MGNEISIIVRAKAMLGQGFAQADREMQAFVKNAKHHTELLRKTFETIAVSLIGVGVAVVEFAKKALEAYSEEERAVRRLESAHRAYGEEVTNNVAAELAMAKAIQEETGIAKDKTITSMAALRMYGVQTSALEECAKAVIALTYAGMDEEGAAKAVAGAYEGNYSKLQKFIPALKMATSESEKATIVNGFLARNYEAQKGQVNTLTGAWTSFKNAVNEALEDVGKRLADSGVLQSALTTIKDLVEQVAKAFADWAQSGGIKDVIIDVCHGLEVMRRQMWDIKNIGSTGTVLAMTQGQITALLRKERNGEALEGDEPEILRKIHAQKEEYDRRQRYDKWEQKTATIAPKKGHWGKDGKFIEDKPTAAPAEAPKAAPAPMGVAGASPDVAARAAAKAQEDADHAAAMQALQGAYRRKMEWQVEAHEKKRAAAKDHMELAAEERDHQDKMSEIQEAAREALTTETKRHKEKSKAFKGEDETEGPEESTAGIERELKGISEVSRREDAAANDRRQAIEHEQQEKKRNAEEIAAVNRRAQEKELQRTEQKMQRELHHAQDLARVRVAEFIAQQHSRDRWDRGTKNEDARAATLRKRLAGMNQGGMHGKLSKQDQEWLATHDKIAAARAAVPKLQQGIKLNQDQRDKLAVDEAKSMADLLTEQRDINKKLQALLVLR